LGGYESGDSCVFDEYDDAFYVLDPEWDFVWGGDECDVLCDDGGVSVLFASVDVGGWREEEGGREGGRGGGRGGGGRGDKEVADY
jgi:hypothetical protein